MQTSNAVKVVIRRACKDALPTKQNLCKKKIVTDPLCPICLKSQENPGHILWSCPSAQDVWLLGNRKMQKAPIIDEEFWNMRVLNMIGPEGISFFAETARSKWIRRNIFEGNFVNPSIMFNRSLQAHEEITQAHNQRSSLSRIQYQQSSLQLQPPPTDWVKMNWDVAIKKTDKKIGVGVVLRDQDGEVLATLMQPVTFCVQAVMAEARGLITAAGWCKNMGLQHVVFEGHSRQVVNAMRNDREQHGMLSCLMRDVKAILLDTVWDIKHIKREGNKVAHQLAQQATS